MMACFCFKSSEVHEGHITATTTARTEAFGQALSRPTVPSIRRDHSVKVNGVPLINVGVKQIQKQPSVGHRISTDDFTRKPERTQLSGLLKVHHQPKSSELHPRPSGMPKQSEGEQVAAGWPSWLAANAGEAIRGWVPRRADSFEKLNKIGQGTYSNVYKARDLESGKIVALKKVRFDTLEPESVRFMAREINILRRLDHPNVIKLEGLVTSKMSGSLYLVFEYMEHDLAGLASNPSLKFTQPQVKCYMQQLLRGLDHCHTRGILHRDIKGSNLLIDNNGILKIADFGLATFFHPSQRQPLTSRVVTLWYRPPELLLGATEYGPSVDLWSSGCILAELFACKPIMPGRTEVEQLHKIFKLCGSPSEDYWRKSKLPHATMFKPQHSYKRCVRETFKDFPFAALSLLDTLLAIDPTDRGTAASALRSEFFTTKPLPCDPSSLPKYPPSKEIDAKRREEEARKQKAVVGSGQGRTSTRKGQKDSRVTAAPDVNVESANSLQKRPILVEAKSSSDKYEALQEEFASGFPFGPAKLQSLGSGEAGGHSRLKISHSGPLVQPSALGKRQKNEVTISKDLLPHDLSVPSAVETGRYPRPDHRDISAPGPVPPTERSGAGTRASQTTVVQDQHNQGRATAQPRRDSKANKIHYSGPLVMRAGNIDQVLKDHELQIQEAVRRSRQEKTKNSRVPAGAPLY